MNTEDKIRLVFAVPLGVLFGLIVSAVATFAALTQWYILPLFLGLAAAVFLFNGLSDRAQLRAIEALSDRPKEELERMKAEQRVGAQSRWPRYVFVAAACCGYGATLIWPLTDILDLVSRLS